MEKDYEYTLKWSGTKPRESLTEAVKYLETYTMWKPCKARLIDYNEYMLLVAEEKITNHQARQIKEGEVGLIALSCYNQYTTTWEGINTAKGDFEAGFTAGEVKYKQLMDHEEAIEINKLLKKWSVEEAKPCTQYSSQYESGECRDCIWRSACPLGSKPYIMNKLRKKLEEKGIDERGRTIRKEKKERNSPLGKVTKDTHIIGR